MLTIGLMLSICSFENICQEKLLKKNIFMNFTQNYNNQLHHTLRELMERKSKRDHVQFTIYQLAKALDMPHSILVKLMHVDQAKRNSNPKIETLAKIADFFKKDGFNITIDDLLNGFKTKSIPVQSQSIPVLLDEKLIPLFSFNSADSKPIGTVKTKISSEKFNVIALLAQEDIKPHFKKGSVFIIDQDEKPIHDNLIALILPGSEKIQIKKLLIIKNQTKLYSLDPVEKPMILTPTIACRIYGVVVQINAKT